jgi:hypothetical protein
VVPPGGIHSGSRILAPYGQTMTMTMTMTNYGDPFVTLSACHSFVFGYLLFWFDSTTASWALVNFNLFFS